MNAETLERHIKNLSKDDFYPVVFLVVEKIFKWRPVKKDRKGDGGVDISFFENEYKNEVGIQVTVQVKDIENKALHDAKGAVKNHNIKQFYFLCNKPIDPVGLHELEVRIENKLGIGATVWGSHEVANFVCSKDMCTEFFDAIKLDCRAVPRKTNDLRETLLHTYFAFSQDRDDLQNEMIEGSVMYKLHEEGPCKRNCLVEECIKLLNLSQAEELLVNGRIDSLLSSGRVEIVDDDSLSLSKNADKEVGGSISIYDQEMSALDKACVAIIQRYGGEVKDVDSGILATLLAKCFVDSQVQDVRDASFNIKMSLFGTSLIDSEKTLKAKLFDLKVPREKVQELYVDLIKTAGSADVIKKLARAVVYVGMREMPDNKGAIVLKTNDWRKVDVYLDTTVAIPFLLASHFGEAYMRYSSGANGVVGEFPNLGARLCLPDQYLDECAMHLIKATAFELQVLQDGFGRVLENSHNGYVSYYYLARQMKLSLPSSLGEFLETVAPSVHKAFPNEEARLLGVSNDLRKLFLAYGVEVVQLRRCSDEELQKKIETEYAYILNETPRGQERTGYQIDHDVEVMSRLNFVAMARPGLVVLTWDKTLISLARKLSFDIWVSNPAGAIDLVRARKKFAFEDLHSLSHKVARICREQRNKIGDVLDKIVSYGNGDWANYRILKEITKIKNMALERMNKFPQPESLAEFDLGVKKSISAISDELSHQEENKADS